jgi:hypothetical protein
MIVPKKGGRGLLIVQFPLSPMGSLRGLKLDISLISKRERSLNRKFGKVWVKFDTNGISTNGNRVRQRLHPHRDIQNQKLRFYFWLHWRAWGYSKFGQTLCSTTR